MLMIKILWLNISFSILVQISVFPSIFAPKRASFDNKLIRNSNTHLRVHKYTQNHNLARKEIHYISLHHISHFFSMETEWLKLSPFDNFNLIKSWCNSISVGRFTFEFESLAWISNPLNNQNFIHIVCTSTIKYPSIQIQNVHNIMDRTWEKDQTKIMYTWMTERWENYNGKVAGLNFCIVNVPSLFAKRDNSIGTCIHYLCSALKLHNFTFPVLVLG